jgi:hypothetical protein
VLNQKSPVRSGIGKSYLALFLAAKAYAEGWLLLYVLDANKLAINNSADIAWAICEHFFAPQHGALFEFDPPIPKLQPILNFLMQLNAWNEERKVLTGTAHAKFERKYIKNGMQYWVVFVTPLSSSIFDKLLTMSPILLKPVIRSK